ncbi:DUF3581 domain-containing protein [Shewanella alkalitolerans]|uniref:DUF3581 domain-containing protein n=1 Tax=Shewanella alkalitolerans TaxID=2864209 RepID=UPI001C65C55D|nr:DUF3581 domain-containing protein [Shewanella alkalitolerans]QYJ97001.1 DUF3581 domain-containing protein [Shewanella alkalitolerans]
MFLSSYFNKAQQLVSVSAQQASEFAKGVAQDFNPIHDVDAKKFCVPGDLLFALVLGQYGLSQKMTFRFEGMVGSGVNLVFPDVVGDSFAILDDKDKQYLSVSRSGESTQCEVQTESFVRSYVAFSGLNFTHVLVPLMKQHGMMINPARPLVIYESMSFDLHTLDFDSIALNLVEQNLAIDGKRGDVTLKFELHCDDKLVGTGEKTLVLSGLRPLEAQSMDEMVARYEARRIGYQQAD